MDAPGNVLRQETSRREQSGRRRRTSRSTLTGALMVTDLACVAVANVVVPNLGALWGGGVAAANLHAGGAGGLRLHPHELEVGAPEPVASTYRATDWSPESGPSASHFGIGYRR